MKKALGALSLLVLFFVLGAGQIEHIAAASQIEHAPPQNSAGLMRMHGAFLRPLCWLTPKSNSLYLRMPTRVMGT